MCCARKVTSCTFTSHHIKRRQMTDDISRLVVRRTEEQWLQRILFLESIAGVPGFTASILRHLRSLRLMKRDGGWINTLLQEAENERVSFALRSLAKGDITDTSLTITDASSRVHEDQATRNILPFDCSRDARVRLAVSRLFLPLQRLTLTTFRPARRVFFNMFFLAYILSPRAAHR